MNFKPYLSILGNYFFSAEVYNMMISSVMCWKVGSFINIQNIYEIKKTPCFSNLQNVHIVHVVCLYLWTSLTYWSTLVQVMACHLFGAKPLPEPILINYIPGNIFQKFYLKFKNFLLKNALGNVVFKNSTILFKPQWASWMFWYWMKDCILFYHKSSFLSGFLPLPVSHDAMCHRVKHAGIVCVGRCRLKVEFNCTWAAFWNIEIPD